MLLFGDAFHELLLGRDILQVESLEEVVQVGLLLERQKMKMLLRF